MQSLNDDEKKQVLGEVLHDELKTIHEYVKDIPKIKRKINRIDQKVDKLSDDMVVVKAVVENHESRITKLETIPL